MFSLRTLKQNALLDTMHRWEVRHDGKRGLGDDNEDLSPSLSPQAEREAIMKRVEAWNKNAEAAGLPSLKFADPKSEEKEAENEKEDEKVQKGERRGEGEGGSSAKTEGRGGYFCRDS